jgi:hypothetical protein
MADCQRRNSGCASAITHRHAATIQMLVRYVTFSSLMREALVSINHHVTRTRGKSARATLMLDKRVTL